MPQLLATILFFIVFIELFLALTVYLIITFYNYFVHEKEKEKDRGDTNV